MKVASKKNQGTGVYVEKKARIANEAPNTVYIHSKIFLMGTRSATIPKSGLVMATIIVEKAMPRLHIELPVNTNPKSVALSPMESLNRVIKYIGYIAAIPLVANAEFAQSNMHHALMVSRCFVGKLLIFI